jgi:hypothetical protein
VRCAYRCRRTAEAVKTGSEKPLREQGSQRGAEQEVRTCPVCGTKFSAARDIDFCPVCILRAAAAEESTTAKIVDPANRSEHVSEEGGPRFPVHQFENYELMLDKEGRPIELGRGAMGVTYKALDVDLRCPVTLKVISERYLGDESARLRFLREAHAAASVRHPNVASVLHLGRTASSYFCASSWTERLLSIS